MTDLSPRAWLDAHVNLETGVGVPGAQPRAGRARRSSASRHAARVPRFARSSSTRRSTSPARTARPSTTRMVTELLATVGLVGRRYTSPHLERVNERIVCNDEPIADAELDEQLRVDRARRARDRSRSVVLRDRAPRRRCAGSPTSRSTSRWSRSVSAERGTRPTWSTAEVAVVTNVSVDHVEYLGEHRRARSRRRRRASSSRAATLVLGETDPDLVPIFAARGAARVRAARRRLRHACQRAGGRRAHARSLHARRPLPRRVPSAARRAPGRQRRDRARRRGGVRRRAARRRRRARRVRAVRSPGRLEVVGRHPLVLLDGAHNVAGAEALRDGARRGVRGRRRARSWSDCCARRSRPRCSRALGLDDVAQLVCAGRRTRARSIPDRHRGGRGRARLPGRAHRGGRLAVADAISAALLATPDDGEIVVTGSLYFVGAARSLLVDR